MTIKNEALNSFDGAACGVCSKNLNTAHHTQIGSVFKIKKSVETILKAAWTCLFLITAAS